MPPNTLRVKHLVAVVALGPQFALTNGRKRLEK